MIMFQFTSHKKSWHHGCPSRVDILSRFDNIIMVIRWIFASHQLNNNTLSQESRLLGRSESGLPTSVIFQGGVGQSPPPPGWVAHIPCWAWGQEWVKETQVQGWGPRTSCGHLPKGPSCRECGPWTRGPRTEILPPSKSQEFGPLYHFWKASIRS